VVKQHTEGPRGTDTQTMDALIVLPLAKP